MNSFTQHVPAFVEIEKEPFSFEFSTTEELISNSWIASWKEHDPARFYRYSLCDHRLMVEKDGGTWFWVLGYIRQPTLVNLPVWTHPKV